LAVAQEEEEVDDEDMGVAETYADYMPSKCEHYFVHHMFLLGVCHYWYCLFYFTALVGKLPQWT
jgi:Zn-finger protein